VGCLIFFSGLRGLNGVPDPSFRPRLNTRILLVAKYNKNSIIIATYSATVGDLDRDKVPFSCVYGSSSNSDLPSTKSESICSVIVTRSWKILISEAFFFVTR
jgi:hypothetical protein